jgi:hypothetical protein
LTRQHQVAGADHDITPHSSWASRLFAERSAELFLDNLDRYRAGAALRNLVDLQAGH